VRNFGLFAIGLMVFLGLSACAERRVVGSGVMATEARDVQGFREVSLSGVGALTIEHGDRESLIIEAEDNILEIIETKVVNERLTIGFDRPATVVPTKSIRYRLTVINLDAIDLSGAGSIVAHGINTDRLEVTVSGAGSLTVAGEADHQDVLLSGVGSYNAEGLITNTASIEVSGAGTAKVQVNEHLEVNVSGAGSVHYLGDPTVESSVTGLGSVKRIGGD
jgi:hypothetical protein